MTIHQWLSVFIQEIYATPLLEWIAIIAAVAEVLLARANKVLLYPAGILSTAIYTWLFLRPSTKLYADAILNSYYLAMSIYGWVLWTRKDKGHTLTVSTMNKQDKIVTAAISLGGWGVLFILLTNIFPLILPAYVPSDVPAALRLHGRQSRQSAV